VFSGLIYSESKTAFCILTKVKSSIFFIQALSTERDKLFELTLMKSHAERVSKMYIYVLYAHFMYYASVASG